MIVVTGATGNVGRPLVQALAAAGEQVTAVSRGVSDVAVPEGVRHQQADLAEPESLAPALDGAEVLFLLQRSATTVLIPGTSSLAHLRENIAAADLKLPAEAVTALDAIGQ